MLKRNYVVLVAATLGVCGVFVSPAHADLKLEQNITVSGVPKQDGAKLGVAQPTTEKMVMYYKGGKQRMETPASIIIHDATTEKTWVLDPQKKTYYEVPSMADLFAASGNNPMASMMELDGDVIVTDLKEEKSIVGKKAHHYSYVMTLKFTVKDPKAPATLASMMPSFVITGDQWTADMPEMVALAKQNAMSMFKNFPSKMGKSFEPLMEKMATMKGVPLEGTQSSKLAFPESAPAMMKDRMPKEPTVRKTTTTVLSEDALPDSLFVVPGDYKKVPAPGTPKKDVKNETVTGT